MDQKMELSSFLQKADWEGGYVSLLGHSGTSYFPDPLKSAAEEVDFALKRLEGAVEEYCQELGFQDSTEAYSFWDEEFEDLDDEDE